MKPKYFLFFFLTFLIFNCSLLIATVRYVSKTGSSTPPYTSWETASDSIQKCINICSFGDTVYVANGNYKELIVMVPGLNFIGAGMDSCIIDTRDLITSGGDISVMIADSCLFKGFKLIVSNISGIGWGIAGQGTNISLITQNKITYANIGILLDASFFGLSDITVYKNIFENVRIGIDIFNSNSFIRKNIIYHTQSIGEGIRIGGFNNNYTPLIDSNYIEMVSPLSNAIYKSVGTTPILQNNIIILKHPGASGILFGYDSVFIKNNSIYAIEGFMGINHRGGNNSELFNNNILGNFNNNLLEVGSSNVVKNNTITGGNLNGVKVWNTSGLVFHYNNVWNNAINYSGFAPDSTNISVDPMVVNDDTSQGELDFHLQKYSPLIDAGDPNILDIDSSRSDIGMFGGPIGESYKYLDLAPRAPINLTAAIDSNFIALKWNKNTEADTAFYKVYRDTISGFQIDSTKLISSPTDTFFVQLNPHNVTRFVYKVTCVDKQGNESEPSEEKVVNITDIDNYPLLVTDYQLYQNFPNPFNPSTTISYRLINRGYVKLYVYDIKGELVSVLVNKEQDAGFYEVEFSSSNIQSAAGGPAYGIQNLASGVYLYQIFIKGDNNIPVFSDIKKMIYLK